MWSGGYPRIWDVGIPPDRWLADYVTTYVERDVRQVLDIGDLTIFRGFLFRLPAWTSNIRKRVVKRAKMHVVDTGLACHLLGIGDPDQLRTHPLRGALFESWVTAEILKVRAHRGASPALAHLRESRGAEIDLIVESDNRVRLVEVRSGATVAGDWMTALRTVAARDGWESPGPDLRLVYGGDRRHTRRDVDVIGWSDVPDVDW
ncbi:hypothetical protein BH23ACT10_BH23ACT10_05000 [soil metagenome]